MTVSAHTPGIPKNPEIVAVIKLIGTWIPKLLPNALRKNNNKAPINIFMIL